MSENTNERRDGYIDALWNVDPDVPQRPFPAQSRYAEVHADVRDLVNAAMRVADAEQADLWAEAAEYRLRMEAAEAEVAIYKAEANAERIHAEDGPCAVCDHLMLEDQIERAEAAEAERDQARSLAATLEARLAQVEAVADTWERGYNSPTASAWAKVHAANLRAALNEDA